MQHCARHGERTGTETERATARATARKREKRPPERQPERDTERGHGRCLMVRTGTRELHDILRTTHTRVDAGDPQAPELSLLRPSVPVRILQALLHPRSRRRDAVLRPPPVALGQLKDLVLPPHRCNVADPLLQQPQRIADRSLATRVRQSHAAVSQRQLLVRRQRHYANGALDLLVDHIGAISGDPPLCRSV